MSHTPSSAVMSAHMQGEAVLLHMDSKKYFRLNETAAFIWKRMERGADAATIVEELCAAFDVTADQARRAMDGLVHDLSSRGLLCG